MKITTFDPIICTKDAASAIALFEALGFERSHRNDNVPDRESVISVRMKNENGYHVDVVQSDKLERDLMTIRINVDNFDEAYEFFTAHGFTPNSEKPSAASYAQFIGMTAPSGFQISLAQHIRK
ncbi:MAG: hypothetical protein IJT77_10980 [Clostridia bacterium]|nr:hypothetical protein [Clostridia bacterium]